MGYACYERDGRDCGYGVPAICDHPRCSAEIDRGVAYKCNYCERFLCSEHLFYGARGGRHCTPCAHYKAPYAPKPDVAEWVEWKLTDESWEEWRCANPEEVRTLRETYGY